MSEQSTTVPTIVPPSSIPEIKIGYTGSYIGPFTITDASSVSVSAPTANGLIYWDGYNGIVIAPGLSAGTYAITLIATNYLEETATWTHDLVIEDVAAPTITFTGTMPEVTANYYDPVTIGPFSIVGADSVEIVSSRSDIIYWDGVQNIYVNTGLSDGEYLITLIATNVGGSTQWTDTLNVAVYVEPPYISPPQYETGATEGYADTIRISGFTIHGTQPIQVSVTGDSHFSWDNTFYVLEVATGLTAGSYQATIMATNSAGSNSHVYTLNIESPMYYSWYIVADDQDRITRSWSTGYGPLPDDGSNWQLVTDRSLERNFKATPTAQENVIFTIDGFSLYKWINGAIVERTPQEIQADRDAVPPPPPSDHERLNNLEAAFNEVSFQLLVKEVITPTTSQAATFSQRLDTLENAFTEMVMGRIQ